MEIRNIKLIYTVIIIIILICSCKTEREKLFEIYMEALEMANTGNYKEAIDILNKNIKYIDRDYFFYFYRGLFTQQQNYLMYTEMAMKDYLIAYKKNKDAYDINSTIGLSYIHLNEYEKAIYYLERAYNLFIPGSGVLSPYWELAEAYYHVGRLNEALEMNTKAIQEESEYSWPYLQRGIILSQIENSIEPLIKYYEIAIEIEPDNLLLKRDLSLRLIEMDYYEEAIFYNNKWLEGFEDYYDWCYADLGYIYMLNGNWNNSYNMLKKAESINNNSKLTLQYLSFYYFFNNNINEAYSYEARARLTTEPSGMTRWKKTRNDFMEGYKNNWQFRKLFNKSEYE
ncbi:MAG: tetratricopeptide repeat protein [Treponema sp.]|nr:tetratricopeptide repeat protein [Treponema sp.]MCL2237051.1 tetratricopeptide repeat protein [Treponema sp.]